MLTVENEYFIRLLLLIFKGGTSVHKKVFMKRLQDERLPLSDCLLLKKMEIVKLKNDKVLTLKQYNILFPSNGTPSDLNKYDISLLSCLLLNIFSRTLEPIEKKAIETIRTLRNEFPAHHPNDSIDATTYTRKWNELHQSIVNLGQGLSSTDKSDLAEIIRCVKDDPIDLKQAIQDIRVATGNNDMFMEHVSTQLENLSLSVKEIYSRQDDTYTALEKLQKQDENRNKSCIIVGEVTIISDNPEAAAKAALILIAEGKKCLESIKSTESVVNNGRTREQASSDWTLPTSATSAESIDTENPFQSSVEALVKDLTDTGGDVVDFTEGSVLLHIQCNSDLVVFDVLNYFKSSKMEQRLNIIAKYLSHRVGSCIQLSANIQEESVVEALRSLQQSKHREYTKKVRFSIKCQNADRVLNVVKLMEGEEWKNDITEVSKYLSDEVGSPVTLISSLDKVSIQQYIDEAREHDNDKESAEKADKTILQTARNMQAMLCQRRIILVGKTGNGKSFTANSILQEDAFIHKRSANTVTEECLMKKGKSLNNLMEYSVVDTPGLFDTEKSVSERALEIQRSVDICPEPHAFLIVFSANNRMTADECFTIDMLRIMFGENIFNHAIVVFTHGKCFESDQDFQQFWKPNKVLVQLIELCGNRVAKIENTHEFSTENEGTRNIFEMIERMSDAGETVYRYKGLKIHRSVIEENAEKYHGKGDIHKEISEIVIKIGQKVKREEWKTMLYGGVLVGGVAAAGTAGAFAVGAAPPIRTAVSRVTLAVGVAVGGAIFETVTGVLSRLRFW